MNIDVFRHPLKKVGLHIDFLRLRCGADEGFQRGIDKLRASDEKPHVFIAFAEWDAVVIMPCERLYPPGLNRLYSTPDVAMSISGNAGYFSYLWEHPINDGLNEKLARFEAGGVGALISLRFEDWLHNKLGLAAELLISDALMNRLRLGENAGIDAAVAHTLGWNDVAILLHASQNEQRLTDLLSWLRILTLDDLLPGAVPGVEDAERKLPVFAASYTHLIGSYDHYAAGTLSLGRLCEEIVAAKLLVRVPASFEPEIRKFIGLSLPEVERGAKLLEAMPSEMGHYSFSANITALAKEKGAAAALDLIRRTRQEIGQLGVGKGGSYAETTTIFTFVERQEGIENLVKPSMSDDIKQQIADIAAVLEDLPRDMAIKNASPMTVHRFASVLVTLIDHLSDPVRSSSVRHAATFFRTLPDRIGSLGRDAIDDLCHVCEAAIGQAIDGVAQFQHDANSIGLSGRGGYSRLITAIEMFARDVFVALHVKEEPPLITFGLRTGTPGSLDRFQIDLPFRVVFTPSDWYILLHEVGHHCWIESFGWMTESVAAYDALSREIMLNRPGPDDPAKWEKIDKTSRAEFLSARSIVRELFPNLLVYRLACGDDLKRFDRLSMYHVLRLAGKSDGTRSMLIAVVLHCLLEAVGSDKRPSEDTPAIGIERAISWWSDWGKWRDRIRAMSQEDREVALRGMAQNAIDSVSETLEELAVDSSEGGINDKQKILNSDAFLDAVAGALISVIEVLALSGQQFAIEESAGAKLFHDVQGAIETAIDDQENHADWSGQFGPLLAEGEVFAFIPPAHVWLWLLLEDDELLRPRSSPEFMVSQLSIVLSMWHRAVTGRPSGGEAMSRLDNVLKPLGFIQTLPRAVKTPV
jgi:hypothetical protein